MAVTQNTYTGDGTTVLFSFTFPYLETTDIKVSLAGVITTAYTLANATTIQFNTAPANGVAIRIYRVTDDAALAAQFYPGSAIRSQDLNENFTQNLYVTQESNRDATSAISTANSATTTANTALSTANSAVSTANTASTNASAAVTTANTASTNASAAVSTANTASSNASAAVNTANAATATANSASSTAATALSTANAATSTANTASTAATNAVNTANAASSAASSAVSTANTASTNASNAVTTANTASTNATTAVNTANTAITTANAASAAVANAEVYTIVANVAAIPASPANNTAIEVNNSTGIESFTPLSGKPVGFIGNSGLSVRIIYQAAGSTWAWVRYFPNDPESRYFKQSGGTLTGAIGVTAGSAGSPSVFISGDTNTGIYSPGADQVAISTNGTQRVLIDASGNVNVKGTLRLSGSTSGYVGLAPAAVAGSVTYTLPSDAGSNGSFLVTDGTGGLSWDPLYIPTPSAIVVPSATAEVVEVGGGYGYFTFSTGGSERFRIDTAGRVLVGTSSPYPLDNYNIDPLVQVASTDQPRSAISVTNTGNNTYGPTLALVKRRSNVNAPALPGDSVGNITFFAETGEYSRPSASIGAVTEGNYTIPAASMVAFQDYYIASVGTTNFTLYGATSNTPGTLFTCTSFGPYSGTGTVIAVNLSGNFVSSRLVFTTTDPSQYNEIERMRITNDGVFCYRQTGVITKSGAATLAVSELKNGIVQYTGAAATLTLPTGTLTEGGFFGIYTNMTFEWSVINTGSGTCTIGAGTGHTIVGASTVTAGESGRFASRRTAANTFVSYRLS